MKRNLKLMVILIIISLKITAQPLFYEEGKIEFERTIHTWAVLDENQYTEEVKKTLPQYKKNYFDLYFKEGESLYRPSSKTGTAAGLFDNFPALKNEVYTNWNDRKTITQKDIFENTYLIEQAIKGAKWKITNDFREIAGFNCRRATTMILDSVFVVAFYTDRLVMPAGPEGINGLPGMVLGLVINRLHTTWYATKVEITSVDEIKPPVKGVKISPEKLPEMITGSLLNDSREAAFGRRYILF